MAKASRARAAAGALRVLALLAACASAPPLGAAEADAPGAAVEELLDLARKQNPDLTARRLEAEAATQRIYPAGAFADPVLRTELNDFTNKASGGSASLLPSRVGSTRYLIMQAVPFWGKRDLRREVAEAEAKQAEGRASLTWTELAARVKTDFAQYYLTHGSAQLTRDILALVTDLERIAQARYATGLAAQQDVIRAQVEQTGLRNDLIRIENEYRRVQARLNALLRRPPGAPFADPQRLRPVPPPAKLDFASLEERIKANNPQLFTLEAEIAAAEKTRELVYKNRYPDFTLGLASTQGGSQIKEWMAMIELNIPLQQRTRRHQESEAGTNLIAARTRKEAALTQFLGELGENLSGLDAAQRTETLNRTSLLPQAEATFQAALVGYQTGKVDFATLLEAERAILRARLDILNAQAEAQARLAEIERLLGEEL